MSAFGGRRSFDVGSSGVTGRVGVKMVGMDRLLLNLSRMQQLPQEGVTKILQILASEFIASVIEFAPKVTGRYARSWRVKSLRPNEVIIAPMGMLPGRPTIGGGVSDSISASKLAVMLEFTGSPPHIIAPRVKSKLLFQSRTGDIVITGKPVNHPGFKPIPHIRLALSQTRRKAKGVIYAVATEYMEIKQWREGMADAARTSGYTGPIPPRQTGRNRKDTNANIGRGTKANLKAKLSRPGFKVKIVARGQTRAVGTNQNFSARAGASRLKGQSTRFSSVGLYSQ